MTHLDQLEQLTERVIGCAIEVHRILGPGLLESIYRECLAMELDSNQLRFASERYVPIDYKGRRVRGALKLPDRYLPSWSANFCQSVWRNTS